MTRTCLRGGSHDYYQTISGKHFCRYCGYERPEVGPLPNPGTGLAKVLALLEAEPQCTADFARNFLPRFGARIHELRKRGHVISLRLCDKHAHPKGSQCRLYTLERS